MIAFTGDMTIRAWTEGSDQIYTQEYTQKYASIPVMEISKGTETEYWYFSNVYFLENNGCLEGVYNVGYSQIEGLAIRPTGTADVYYNGKKLRNNQPNYVRVMMDGLEDTMVFSVSQEGMKPMEYVVKLVREEPFNNGDADDNGIVNAEDAAIILVYAAQVAVGETPEEPDAGFLDRCDVEPDYEINALDAAQVLIRAAMEGAGA